MYKRELAEKMGVSKSTVYNAHKELEEYGLVKKKNGMYELTKQGELATVIHYGYMNQIFYLTTLDGMASSD